MFLKMPTSTEKIWRNSKKAEKEAESFFQQAPTTRWISILLIIFKNLWQHSSNTIVAGIGKKEKLFLKIGVG